MCLTANNIISTCRFHLTITSVSVPYTMAPTPQEHVSAHGDMLATETIDDLSLDGERIVISGMSGLYPQSHNVKELSEKLYNKENLVTSEGLRWDFVHPELLNYAGMLPDLDRFDAQFFAVHHHLGQFMDPMSRKLLEQTYQALYDAGISPAQLNGKKVAVFVGSSFSDSEKTFMNTDCRSGLGLLGNNKTMFANRISYWLNAKGPSLSIDESDCSATTALEQAYHALRRGECETAIVGSSIVSLGPHLLIHHGRTAGVIPWDGKTKSFSEDSNGYVVSDAINVICLQKAKDALRVYAELMHVKNEFVSIFQNEMGPKYGYCRDPKTTAAFIKQFYKEVKVSPQAVEYVEAYGTGVPDADKAELESIEEVYCEDREEPLLVGSVTSNLGLTASASGLTAITKVLLGYHTGILAANLHCENPRQDVVALRKGKMRIVTEHQRFRRTYVAVNGMSVTGANSHVLLHGNYKPKDLARYKSSIPRLVTISARQEDTLKNIFENLKSRPLDAEEFALLHNIHAYNISGHLGRGYAILDTDENQKTMSLCEKAEYFDDARRPLWFVYSGMGSQWAGMGAQLMRIPIFAAAIERCDKVLKPRGLDIVNILTSTDKTIFDNILHSFVGIAAVQIGLTDTLRELGLKPDGIIGHSVGELGCSYADDCLTAEEMILCAYSRGYVSLKTDLIRGSMAAVGLGYEQISKMCPPEIDVACRNGPDSSTISGPAAVMKEFVAELTAKGIFAREVPCSNIAYHSRYIAAAGPDLLKQLQNFIKDPKPRSSRWLSTSVPQEKWNVDLAKYCSAEYHTNNLLSPVLFEETSRLVPGNAVLVEVAPHGLLQAILKRAMPADCRHVPLTRRGHPDNALLLLQAIGDLYMHGYTPNLQALYPKVQFPVSTGTPMLSHLVEWAHVETWKVSTSYSNVERKTTAVCNFKKSIHDKEYQYLQGHVIREKMCYPFAAALVAAWDMLAMHSGVPKKQLSVMFHDVFLHAQPILHDQHPLRLVVQLHRGTGRFEISVEDCKILSGIILGDTVDITKEFRKIYEESTEEVLSSKDVYQLLQERDYNYSGDFLSIETVNMSITEAAIEWHDNWVTFIDGLLQLNVLRQPHTGVSQPTYIRKICIDLNEHLKDHHYNLNGKTVLKANVSENKSLTRCGGVFIQDIAFRNLVPVSQEIQKMDLVIPTNAANQTNDSVPKQKRTSVKSEVILQCAQIGDLESLNWVETPQLEQSGVTVTVHYAGLGVSDAKKAIGIITCDHNLYGMDYSGTTETGERVMGLVARGAASSVVRAQPELLWPVPAHWSFEDAATVPLAYAHALYCLKIKGRLQPGMKVLVHGGAGALGQAAIAVALAYKCTVFTTVSDLRKKKFLRKLYPQLKDENIGNSRDGSFADDILFTTQGVGCDIIISCVKGELRNVSLKCCAMSGVLIDTDQIQNRENFEYGMFFMTKGRNYLRSDLTSIFTQNNYEDIRTLQGMLSEGISAGYVRPLSRVTYAPHDAARAFRLLATSRHRGRVLLRMQQSVLNAQPRIICNPDQCQLLFWDNDAFGAQLADKLINSGAKKLFIHCASSTAYQRYKIQSWQKLGVEGVVSTTDLTKNNFATSIINDANVLGPIEGIYVAITKVDNTKKDLTFVLDTLDAASRSLCPQLKYFAVVSTVSAVGQNTCLYRAKSGLAATSLDLSGLSENECRSALDTIERALSSASPVLLVQPAQTQAPALLQQLAELAEISIPKDADPGTTLFELGIADDNIPAICTFLSSHNIHLEERDIPLLTVNKLVELGGLASENIIENVTGLGIFFSNANTDELLATTDIVLLPTLGNDVTLSSGEFDVNQKYLNIVPGMEGHHERFRVLCERLKLPALVLQPGLDRPHETVRETAERYAQILTTKTKIQNNFYLLGYESGVLVALELAAILEDQGLTGRVFMVGSSPDEFQTTLEDQLRDFKTEEQLQDAVIRHMSTVLAGGYSTDSLNDALRDGDTFTQKLDACIRILSGHLPHSAQYVRAVIEAALARITSARGYVLSARALRSRLVLLRAATAHATSASLALQRHSQQPVAVHQLRSPLSFVSKDMECTAIIHQYLDTDILNAFENMNLCETSLIK